MKFNRRAEWIWINKEFPKKNSLLSHVLPDLEPAKNLFVYFRKVFFIDKNIKLSSVYISVDGRYQLFINGKFVGRGPARCHPLWQYVDLYDVSSYLKKGNNIIAVLVHSYGQNTSWYELPKRDHLTTFDCGGLYFQGDVECEGNKIIILDSNENWKYKISEAWKKDVPFGGTGYVEYFNANKEPDNWKTIEGDDSNWNQAQILRLSSPMGGNDIISFPHMVERDIPLLYEEIHYPQSIIRYGEVENIESLTVCEQMRKEKICNLDSCKIIGYENLLKQKGSIQIITTNKSSAVLIFDFGKIVAGRVRFKVEAPIGSIMDIAYSEKLTGNGEIFLPLDVPGISITPAHRVYLKEGIQNFEQFEMAGFRYLQFTFRKCVKPLIIKSIGLNFTCYPAERKGYFKCSDDALNRIWNAGEYTARVCRQDGFIDCPSREQRQWVGDVYVQSLVNYVVEKDIRLVSKFLRQVAQTQRSDGITMMATTCDLEADGSVFIPDFSLLWILIIEKYVLYTGDLNIIKELLPSMIKTIRWFQNYLNSNNLLSDLPNWTFIDWSVELDRKGVVTVLNILFVGALRAVSSLEKKIGGNLISEEFKKLSLDTKEAINNILWDEERGVYVDAFNNGVKSNKISQQANSLVIYFEVAPKERWERIFKTILDDKRVKLTRTWRWDKERSFDPHHDVIMAQPFFSHFLHGALFKTGGIEYIVRSIKTLWGPMIEEGSTFWESWQLTDITSTCHGFSATPTYDLSTYILGIFPLEDGFKKFRISPFVSNLNWAKGEMPTPYGVIAVVWKKNDKQIVIKFTVPPSLQAEVILPEGFRSDQNLLFPQGEHKIIGFKK